MIVWYLLAIAGQPVPKIYPQAQEQQACADYLAAPKGSTIWQESGRKDSPTIVLADCKPIQQIVVTK